MNRVIILLVLLGVGIGQNLYALDTHSMRRCAILPIVDQAGDSLGFKVYEGVERELKRASWCDYASSSDILEVFSRYRNNLESHLQDERVLQTIAQELSVGTIIKVTLDFQINNVEVKLDVVGENGKDLYLSEKETFSLKDADLIVTKLVNWLDVYSETIPYDGKVLGALGDEITFSHPSNSEVEIGQEFSVVRLKSKNRHPLLKKIIEWNILEVARGSVTNINKGQSLATIKVYNRGDRIAQGDWVTLGEKPADTPFRNAIEDNNDSFGKLGVANIFFDLGTTTLSTKTATSNRSKGITYGVSADVEAWVTRNYFATGMLSRRLGSIKKESGSLALSEANYGSSAIKVGGGYKWLPLGYFNGPQVNFKLGYAQYGFDIERSDSDGFGQNNFNGFYLAIGGNMPVKRGWRVFGEAQVIPFVDFKDTDSIYGSVKRASSMAFNGGVKYQYRRNLTLDGVVEVQNHSAKFKSGVSSDLSYRDMILKFGVSFIF